MMRMVAIRDYLQLVGRATLQDLARHFKIQETAMEHMLLFWIKKGLISRHDTHRVCLKGGCHGCHSCDDAALPVYIWRCDMRRA